MIDSFGVEFGAILCILMHFLQFSAFIFLEFIQNLSKFTWWNIFGNFWPQTIHKIYVVWMFSYVFIFYGKFIAFRSDFWRHLTTKKIFWYFHIFPKLLYIFAICMIFESFLFIWIVIIFMVQWRLWRKEEIPLPIRALLQQQIISKNNFRSGNKIYCNLKKLIKCWRHGAQ